jgi:hypothetical protein
VDAGPDAHEGGSEAGTDGGREAGMEAGSEAGAEAGSEAGTDGGREAGMEAGSDSGCTGATPVSLTVINAPEATPWCSISIAGATASSNGRQTMCVAAGPVTLVASPVNATFILGLWHGTVGDTGAGNAGTVTGTGTTAKSTTSVDVTSGSACVWVCCPFANGTGCPTTLACP